MYQQDHDLVHRIIHDYPLMTVYTILFLLPMLIAAIVEVLQ